MPAARTVLALGVLFLTAAGLQAQPGREACVDAARALVRQNTSWDDAKGRFFGDDVLRWRAADGTRGSCRVDSRGRVYQVQVDSWGDGGIEIEPPSGGYGGLTEEFGFDRRGDDYTSFSVRTAGHCQDACRRDDRCRAYTYSSREGRCWLKSRVNSPQADRDKITGYKTEDSGGAWGGGRLTEERGYDRRGNDYTSFGARRLDECQDACRRDGRCRAYTYDTRNGACYLKDRINSAQYDAGMVTGYKEN